MPRKPTGRPNGRPKGSKATKNLKKKLYARPPVVDTPPAELPMDGKPITIPRVYVPTDEECEVMRAFREDSAGNPDRQTLTWEVAQAMAGHVRAGNFIGTAAEATGIPYQTFRRWMRWGRT